MQETSPPSETSLSISGFKYNHKAFTDALEFKRLHDPAFKDIKSWCSFAEKFGISESTVKRIFGGKSGDFMVSIFWYLCKILGIEPAIVLYLAPPRDYDLERQLYDPTLMGNLRRQVAALEAQLIEKDKKIEELQSEITKRESYERDLRERILKAEKELSAALEKAAEYEKVKKHKHHLAVCLFVSAALTITVGGLMIYFLWELQNPNAGNWQF